MRSMRATIQKVLTALNYNGCIMVIDHKGVYVHTLGRVVTKHYLKYYQPTAVYNELNLDEKKHKNPDSYDFVAVDVMDSFREVNILKELVGWLKGTSEHLRRIQKGIPLRLRTQRQLEGWLADHPEVHERILVETKEEYELEQAEKKARLLNRRRKKRKDVQVREEADSYDE